MHELRADIATQAYAFGFTLRSMRDPVYREEEEAFISWLAKTPLARRNQKAIELEIQAKLEKESGTDKKRRK